MKKRITLGDKDFQLLIEPHDIGEDIWHLAHQLNSLYEGQEVKPLLLVVLNGAVPFAMDLIKKLRFDFDLDFTKVSSYKGAIERTHREGMDGLAIEVDGQLDPTGRDIILIEDVVDTGDTVTALKQRLLEYGADTVETCTLLFKPEVFNYEYRPRFIGSFIPDRFVVGYGMDYKGLGRGLPGIYQLVE